LDPSSATELSASSWSSAETAARAAASTRLRGVSELSSSATALVSPNPSVTWIEIRCGRLPGATVSESNSAARRIERSRTASLSSASMGRTSAVWAMLILR
jgi:hypothetical protein